MTEEEAKTKWCPFVQESKGIGSWNRPRAAESDTAARYNCIGSDCMAWQWEPMVEISKDDYEAGILINKHPLADVRYVGSDGYRRVEIPTGFCGLAGKP